LTTITTTTAIVVIIPSQQLSDLWVMQVLITGEVNNLRFNGTTLFNVNYVENSLQSLKFG